ncbi:hypothetical protein K402DRAFT_379667 [Aulographum hederae CBS 113979]|uniref:BAG domain-containing protein n=1 Tax=Aulographum hederae CBS 113979 TaxID=1176131 RepID=A0A6G1GX17_9PEZI|nr:hypothetical protein K402DRAFT_379667 [Aulographum hederae CBS 113979]
MSWSGRFSDWSSRLSPFARSPANSVTVNDSDFSYITADDLARSQSGQNGTSDPTTPVQTRDTDVLILKHRNKAFPVHFPEQCIDQGELSIGELRAAAAKKLDIGDPNRIKLFYKGRNLKDDNRLARAEGFRSGAESEILCVAGERPMGGSDFGSSEDSEDAGESASKPKRKRNTKKKRKGKKSRGGDSGTATPNGDTGGTSTPIPPPHAPLPQTAIGKIEALASLFHTQFVPLCVQYTTNPPADEAKRAFEHKKLTETILAQVLLKLDAVETEGDPDARMKRKELVREVQGMLNRLDEVAGK